MANIGKARVEFYWIEHYGSYAEAKTGGGVRTIAHDFLDSAVDFRNGIAADIRDHVLVGADTVHHKPKLSFLLFNAAGELIDAC